jgi:hypothetical protein
LTAVKWVSVSISRSPAPPSPEDSTASMAPDFSKRQRVGEGDLRRQGAGRGAW